MKTTARNVFHLIAEIRERADALFREGRSVPGDGADPVPRDGTTMEAAEIDARLPLLEHAFELPELARRLIVCLLAVEYDPALRPFVRSNQSELGRPWIELGSVAQLLALSPGEIPAIEEMVEEESCLHRFALVEVDAGSLDAPVVGRRLKLSRRIARYLVGKDTLPEGTIVLGPMASRPAPLVAAVMVNRVTERVRQAAVQTQSVVVEIVGAAGTGRRTLASEVTARLGRKLIVLDLARMGPTSSLAARLAELARDARIEDAVPCIANWDVLLPRASSPADDGASAGAGGSTRPDARRLPSPLERFLNQTPIVVFVTAEEREPLLEQSTTVPVIVVEVPFPTPSQRTRLLEGALAHHGATWDATLDVEGLARRFALEPARISTAAQAATELSRLRDPSQVKPMVTWEDLNQGCRRQLRHDLRSLAARVTATHKWEDLVVSGDIVRGLEDMIGYVRHARQVYEHWGFAKRHSLTQGLSALFAGPPGTGKTMCASVMARELDMELFRVDLSRVVSKWIGETEKNLGRVFDEAQRSNAIILFDEADALFAKRTEVKSSVDRYANLEVNFLLQRMEAFGGVTILTTNFEDTIDTAFKRRLTFRLTFEKPDEVGRAMLWQKMFPPECDLAADVDFAELGHLYELSGGVIRNAAVRAAFVAAEEGHAVDMKTCLVAAEREAREMGLLVRSVVDRAAVEDSRRLEEAAPAPEPVKKAPARMVPITHPRR